MRSSSIVLAWALFSAVAGATPQDEPICHRDLGRGMDESAQLEHERDVRLRVQRLDSIGALVSRLERCCEAESPRRDETADGCAHEVGRLREEYAARVTELGAALTEVFGGAIAPSAWTTRLFAPQDWERAFPDARPVEGRTLSLTGDPQLHGIVESSADEGVRLIVYRYPASAAGLSVRWRDDGEEERPEATLSGDALLVLVSDYDALVCDLGGRLDSARATHSSLLRWADSVDLPATLRRRLEPQLDARVLRVEGDAVRIDRGAQDGLTFGARLEVRGSGRRKGIVSVSELGSHMSTASVLERFGGTRIESGDLASSCGLPRSRPAVFTDGRASAGQLDGVGHGATGHAGSYPAQGVQLMSQLRPLDLHLVGSLLPPAHRGAKCWGYTSPAQREYAIMGTYAGTSFVEVTDPGRPRVVGFVDGPDSAWRAARVFGEHAYIVSEGGAGIQVVDLAHIDAGAVRLVREVTAGGVLNTHNVALDVESGFLYRVNEYGSSPALRAYDLSDPADPQFSAYWDERVAHDARVVTYTSGPFAGREIAYVCTLTVPRGLTVLDVTDKTSITTLAHLSYPSPGLPHQVWLSEDRQWAFLQDESQASNGIPSTIYVFDVSDVDAPFYAGSFTNGNPARTHDSFVKGDRLYCANWTSGLRVFDVSDPLQGVEVAWFDTYPFIDSDLAWSLISNYPFFASGTVIGGDINGGLFVWTMGDAPLEFDFPVGPPSLLDETNATFVVEVREQQAGALAPDSVELYYDAGAGTQVVPLVSLGGDAYGATLPSLPCGALVSYFVSARTTGGFTWTAPRASHTLEERYYANVGAARTIVFQDDFETDRGWTTKSSGPNRGFWERVDPNGTPDAPEDDYSTAGTHCFVTENGIPDRAGFDVDGGPYVLTSPAIPLGGLTDARVRYARWFVNKGKLHSGDDALRIQVSNDGQSWLTVQTLGPMGPGTNGGWVEHQFRVADFVPPSLALYVRFIASDARPDSGLEVAIDDFVVFDPVCR